MAGCKRKEPKQELVLASPPVAPTPAPVAPTTAPGAPTPSPGAPCLADAMRGITIGWSERPECETDEARCQAACRDGDRSSCFQLGDLLVRTDGRRDEAQALFKRSCELGLALGCVNFGADLWRVNESSAAEPAACARRIFTLACDVGDSMGCAMVGRMMVEDGTPKSRADTRAYFEDKCDAMKGPPCRMLAWYLEQGQLGTYEPGRLRVLMAQACEGNDPAACGEWERVEDTFH